MPDEALMDIFIETLVKKSSFLLKTFTGFPKSCLWHKSSLHNNLKRLLIKLSTNNKTAALK